MHAAIICHDDAVYLAAVIHALGDVPVTVFVNEVAWGGAEPGDWVLAAKIAEEAGAKVISGTWPDEHEHRVAVLNWAKREGIRHLLIPDSDEIISPELLESLRKIASAELSDAVYVSMLTYWKSPEYVIDPPERLMPAIMIGPETVQYQGIRQFRGSRPLMLSHDHGVLHHLSYAGPESRIERKVSTWSHKDELVPNWWKDIWQRWDGERDLTNLHPTVPEAYGRALRKPVPGVLEEAWDAYLAACGGEDPLHGAPVEPQGKWPKVSVVIPLYGGPEDVRLCLASLGGCSDLLHEVIVVDDASPDNAPDVVKGFGFATLLQNTSNLGFGATCNRGAAEYSGDIILFLNSDTVVPRPGLIRLIEALMKSGAVAAAGPKSNSVGHYQWLGTHYANLDEMALLADDLARGVLDDFDCDMLVGFCLAVRRSAWDEVGGFDESFRVGMFEDNDLCYRLRRLGYRLVVSQRAFVHHKGNASLDRHPDDKVELFRANEERYLQKWKDDLSVEFVSHLPGLEADRVRFDLTMEPARLRQEVAELAPQASISLCMIVRNEERVLGDCLASAKPFFSQIVVVDTGSTDRTIEIAREHGAEVYEMVWPDSFSAARNESLKYATGDWVCWIDADDTLPLRSGYSILKAVLNATDDLGGLVIPVRFVTDDPAFGTSVDHVKVFRNHRGWKFEGRIHEQILQDIRKDGLNIARLAAEVLHSGYDTSEEGQEKKRIRDEHLLMLDLQDRPGHPFVLFNLGMTTNHLQKHEQAIEWMKQSIAASNPEDSTVRKAYVIWANSTHRLGGAEAGLEVVETGLAAVPDDPELLFWRGRYLAELGHYEPSAAAYERLLVVGRGGHFGSMDTSIFGFKTFHNLAGVYWHMGNYGRARSNYLAAIQSNPRFTDSAISLFDIALSNRDFQACRTCLGSLQRLRGFPRDVLGRMSTALNEAMRA